MEPCVLAGVLPLHHGDGSQVLVGAILKGVDLPGSRVDFAYLGLTFDPSLGVPDDPAHDGVFEGAFSGDLLDPQELHCLSADVSEAGDVVHQQFHHRLLVPEVDVGPFCGRQCFSTHIPSLTICIPGKGDDVSAYKFRPDLSTNFKDPQLLSRIGFLRIDTNRRMQDRFELITDNL